MKSENIVRSWKDEDYRLALSDADQAFLPLNPAGLIELSDDDLKSVEGGTDTRSILPTIRLTLLFCPPPVPFTKGCKLED